MGTSQSAESKENDPQLQYVARSNIVDKPPDDGYCECTSFICSMCCRGTYVACTCCCTVDMPAQEVSFHYEHPSDCTRWYGNAAGLAGKGHVYVVTVATTQDLADTTARELLDKLSEALQGPDYTHAVKDVEKIMESALSRTQSMVCVFVHHGVVRCVRYGSLVEIGIGSQAGLIDLIRCAEHAEYHSTLPFALSPEGVWKELSESTGELSDEAEEESGYLSQAPSEDDEEDEDLEEEKEDQEDGKEREDESEEDLEDGEVEDDQEDEEESEDDVDERLIDKNRGEDNGDQPNATPCIPQCCSIFDANDDDSTPRLRVDTDETDYFDGDIGDLFAPNRTPMSCRAAAARSMESSPSLFVRGSRSDGQKSSKQRGHRKNRSGIQIDLPLAFAGFTPKCIDTFSFRKGRGTKGLPETLPLCNFRCVGMREKVEHGPFLVVTYEVVAVDHVIFIASPAAWQVLNRAGDSLMTLCLEPASGIQQKLYNQSTASNACTAMMIASLRHQRYSTAPANFASLPAKGKEEQEASSPISHS